MQVLFDGSTPGFNLGGLLSFSLPGWTEKLLGCGLLGGNQYPGWHYELFSCCRRDFRQHMPLRWKDVNTQIPSFKQENTALSMSLSVCLFVSVSLSVSVYKIKPLFLDKTYLLFANWVSLKTLTNRPPTVDHLLTNQPTTKHRPTDHRPNATTTNQPTTREPENIRIYIWHNLVTVRYWRKHLKWSMHAEIFSKEF